MNDVEPGGIRPNEDEELDVEEIDDTSSLEGDEPDTRRSVVLEDDENGQIIRVGRSAQEEYPEEEEEEQEETPEPQEEERAEDVPVPVAAGAAEETDELPEPAEESRPHYNGFSLTPDGLGVWELAYEDANSPEAEALIYGSVDEDGNEITKGIGEREYARRCSAYEVSKIAFAQAKTQEVDAIIQSGIYSMRQELDSLNTDLAKRFKVPVEAVEGFDEYKTRAFELIDKDREMRAEQYIAAGYDAETAVKLANRDVLGRKGIVSIAFRAAVMEKEEEYLEKVHAIKLKAAGQKPTPAPVKATEESLPSVPATSTGGSAAAPTAAKRDLRKYNKMQLLIARQTGIDPDKLTLN